MSAIFWESGPSAARKAERGSLLELSWNGTGPLELPGGARRSRRRRFACNARLVSGRRLSRRLRRGRGLDRSGGPNPAPRSLQSEAEQSRSPGLSQDCFVARKLLAMTVAAVQRSSGAISRMRADARRCRQGRRTDARVCLTADAFSTDNPGRHSFAGRIGRGTKPPPQFGHTLCNLPLTQSAQNVHS